MEGQQEPSQPSSHVLRAPAPSPYSMAAQPYPCLLPTALHMPATCGQPGQVLRRLQPAGPIGRASGRRARLPDGGVDTRRGTGSWRLEHRPKDSF
ncbi:hypothetical protein PAL_GLEAN10001670 [Pteropus alecto]|uniref:Uncharacterized protein n=1 Tax=Pteropus alecto TaxID=9402 RepID=L5L1S4_PTEAL|nr:hypothetical protein PAL_GLEAN10001670 [Pteropus alecto]